MALQVTGQAQGLVQTVSQKAGAPAAVSTGWHNEILKSDLLPRFSYLALAGTVYSCSTAGAGVTLAAQNLFSTAIATLQPILCLYNPLSNTKNFVVLSAWAGLSTATATQATTGGLLFICNPSQNISNAQSATPVSNLTLKAVGSSAIGITNVALTGAVGNATVLRPMQAPLANTVTSITAPLSATLVDPIDGAIIVPPGGYLGIANGISVATGNVVAGFTWAELPV